MSRLRHKKASGGHVMAGACSGVHRLQVDKPHSFKPDEEKKHGGHVKRAHGGSCFPEKMEGSEGKNKLGRRRGGSVKKKIIGQDGKASTGNGTHATPDRGMKFGTPLQATRMDNSDKVESKHLFADGGKVRWIQKAIRPEHKGMEQRAAHKAGLSTHQYMEKHKHDSGKSGARARLGLRLSAMAKHKG